MDSSEDPGDNKFLECALEADARYLVSGDSDLLDLGEFRGVDIVDASEFLEYRTKFKFFEVESPSSRSEPQASE